MEFSFIMAFAFKSLKEQVVHRKKKCYEWLVKRDFEFEFEFEFELNYGFYLL